MGLTAQQRDLTGLQMCTRATAVFFLAIAIIRVGDERFMGRHTALDVMLGIVFGAVASRGITGGAPFVPTMAACLVLVALHWIISALSNRSTYVAFLFTGRSHVLVADGELNRKTMIRTHISPADLHEAIRSHGKDCDFSDIKRATLERSGAISVVFMPKATEIKENNKPPEE